MTANIEAIQIGGLLLTRYTDIPGWEGKMWIEREDGEGMQCDVAKLESVITKFYEDNF
jgi:hypothetical protein